jgi:G3E family GTPase
MAIPLTVIGGFLGAGKTTLVNALLRRGAKRWGVVVNDFGAVNVDAALIEAQDGRSIALSNGCVCCTMGDDLGDALALLAGRSPPPEHVIVEASGVGDPWRIAQLALIEPGFVLEPLVVLANAEALVGQLADRWTGDTVRRQLEFAEIVLLTRTDIADAGPAEAAVRAIRPQAVLRAAVLGDVPEAALRFAPPARASASRFIADAPPPFVAWDWVPPGALDPVRLRALLGDLPRAVLRVKGFCRLGSDMQLLQYAAERWAFTPAPEAAAEGLVVIGTPEMDVQHLTGRLAATAL